MLVVNCFLKSKRLFFLWNQGFCIRYPLSGRKEKAIGCRTCTVDDFKIKEWRKRAASKLVLGNWWLGRWVHTSEKRRFFPNKPKPYVNLLVKIYILCHEKGTDHVPAPQRNILRKPKAIAELSFPKLRSAPRWQVSNSKQMSFKSCSTMKF